MVLTVNDGPHCPSEHAWLCEMATTGEVRQTCTLGWQRLGFREQHEGVGVLKRSKGTEKPPQWLGLLPGYLPSSRLSDQTCNEGEARKTVREWRERGADSCFEMLQNYLLVFYCNFTVCLKQLAQDRMHNDRNQMEKEITSQQHKIINVIKKSL